MARAKSLKSFIGRVRQTRVVSPAEAGYISSMRQQMKQIEDNYAKLIDQVIGVTPEILKEVMQPIFDKSQELVPVRTGDLKNSGFLEARQLGDGRVQVEIGYGRGGWPPYTVFVHENLEMFHAPPTQAKFLEDPLVEGFDDMKAGLLQRYQELFR